MPVFATIERHVSFIRRIWAYLLAPAPYLAIIFYQARFLKSFQRGSFSLRNDKSILKCHLYAFADKILPSFQSELYHFSKLRRYAISLILDGRIVLLNLKFRNLRDLRATLASKDVAFIFKFCTLVERKIPRGVLMQIPREA